MSHYTVMVLGDCPEDQLAPFNENIEGVDPEDLDFADCTADYEEEFQRGTVDAWQLPSGEILLEGGDKKSKYQTGPTQPKRGSKITVAPSDIYPDLDQFVLDYHGQTRHPETGKFGYFYNSQAKWDWYQLGGRWTGFFKLKKNRLGTAGEPGIFSQPAKKGYVDQALKKDIDFDGMRKSSEKKAQVAFDEAMSIIGHLPPNVPWEQILEKFPSESNHDLARSVYWSQPRCEAWKRHHANEHSSPDPFLLDRESFIRSAGNKAWMTFALLDNGAWHEQGHMGWFGVATDKTEEQECSNFIDQTLQKAPEDTLISVYDCHI